MPGVIRTRVGYSGGVKAHPTYHSLGDHSETVEVDYDPARVSYAELLAAAEAMHDPFARAYSRQYRAAVFYHGEAERREAEAWRDRLAAQSGREVQTAILPAGEFWPAEDYHQKYYLRQVPSLLRELAAYYPDGAGLARSKVAARLNGYIGGHGTAAQLTTELPLYGLSPAGVEVCQRLARELNP